MRRALCALFFGSLLAIAGCSGDTMDDGGDDSTPAGNPEIIEFVAAADAVPRGEAVQLSWKVKNARTVTIFSATEILVTTSELEGSVMTLPLRARSGFTLRATGSGPAVGAGVEVAVIWPEPTIHAFTAMPDMTFIQGITTLRWTTEEAETVRILENGNPVPNATFEGAQARGSAISVIVNSATTTYTLEAENPTHTKSAEVVVYAGQPPTLTRFTATPRTFIGTSTLATLTWESNGFDRLELQANFFPVSIPQTSTGSYTMEIYGTTEFYFVGYLGEVPYGQLYAISAHAAQEYEPNDDQGLAWPITYEGGVIGRVDRTDDVDYYLLDVYEPTNLRVWIRGAEGGCPTDTSIEMIEAFRGAVEPIGGDQDDGIPTGRGGACPEISPERDEFVQRIVGSYFIVVRGERSETGPYILLTEGKRP